MKILSSVPSTVTVEHLNRWLESKGAPAYAHLYQAAGDKYGVRFDYAIFQSCIETGFWTFRGDVSADQNNFAGIGATGNGATGESFESPQQGILAQIQHLALYGGKSIPKDELVAERSRYVHEWILGQAPNFEDLAGKWAADKSYALKINSMAKDFDSYVLTLPKATKDSFWVDIFRDGEAYLMQGSLPVDVTHTNKEVNKLALIKEYFGNRAGSYALAPHDKPKPDFLVKDLPKPEPKPEILRIDPEHTKPGAKLAWIPWALDWKRMNTKYVYANGFPVGCIVHHTAGGTVESSLESLATNGYPCLGLGRDGKLYQPFPLTHGGPHCGTSHHRTHVGLEIAGWGKLQFKNGKYWAWPENYTRQTVPAHKVRHIPKQNDNQQAGYYEMFTPEQENMIIKFLLWCKINAPTIFKFENVLGHDQINPSNKNDPGGSLSMTMTQLRALLESEYQKWLKMQKA